MALRPDRTQNRSEQLAERRAAEQDVLLREIDEAVRQDELADYAQRYGKAVIAVIVAGLLAFGAYLFWDSRRDAAREQDSEELVRAVDHLGARNFDAGTKALVPLAKSGSDGASASARMLQAGIALEQERATEALALFREVAEDGDAPQPYRDLAAIRAVALNFDAMKPEEVISRLKGLAVPGNPWFGSAGELVAMAYLKQGRRDLAGPLFAAIAKSESTPETLRSRARQMAGLLGVDAIDEGGAIVTKVEGAEPPAAE